MYGAQFFDRKRNVAVAQLKLKVSMSTQRETRKFSSVSIQHRSMVGAQTERISCKGKKLCYLARV